ncbi:MAG TPA: glycerol dehydrogenase [Giesbergeria sp.]|jgi:glycerol dehydrogenase|nr:glycerol dehydrogenase [Giesbergeria sp.]
MNALPESAMTFGAPGLYVQGPGMLDHLEPLLNGLGKRPMVLLSKSQMGALRGQLERSLGALAEHAHFELFPGECTARAIAVAAQAGRDKGCDLIVGIGGGKTIDAAKGAQILLNVPLAIVPSIASNDAPTSRLVVLYDENHVLSGTRLMKRSPDVVCVDTTLIANAPARFLLAGIGDAISKKFEASQAVAAGGRNFFGGRGGQTALAIADSCYRTLCNDGPAAMQAAQRRQPDAAFERLVEACVLGSGLGFESGGLSIAHSLLRGLTTIPSLGNALHGELVAVSLLTQLCASSMPEAQIVELLQLYQRIGLPSTFEALGLTEVLDEVARRVAQTTVATSPYVGNFEIKVTEQVLSDAMLRADRLARSVQ